MTRTYDDVPPPPHVAHPGTARGRHRGPGRAGVVLLYQLGGRADLILRENYASVQAMFRLNEAAERIDSGFQFALAGRQDEARRA